jgi:hypothetical protein
MSSKSTISSGEEYHLYQEVFDSKNVYLELSNTSYFRAEQGTVCIRLTPDLLTQIAIEWQEKKDLFDNSDFDFCLQTELFQKLAEKRKQALSEMGD